MKALPAVTFALTLLAAALPAVGPVQAGTGIQRCQTPDGTTVYSDTACAAFGATAKPLPGDVLTRIARDEARMTPADAAAYDVAQPGLTAAPARRSPTEGCARSTTQLAMDLRASLVLGDVNRLAESYHWVGMTSQQSQPVMHRLERLAAQPLEDLDFFDAQIGGSGLQLAAAGGADATAGVMQLRFGGEARQVLDLGVERYSGCYFVKF